MISSICICGIGYVGLTLAAVMAEQGFHVTGVDTNPSIVAKLNQGKPHFFENGLSDILHRHLDKNLRFLDSIPPATFDAFIITVGTPLLSDTHQPDLSSLIKAAESVSQNLHGKEIVILRSTVPLGATRQIVYPILKKKSQSVRIAFCPERTIEGKALEEIKTLPQIVGGLDQESTILAIEIFCRLTPNVVPVSSLETAELIKLVDNSYRDITFAYANQIAEICQHMGIDTTEVIFAANQDYPRNRIPSPGFVGGACLEKDPYILAYSSSPHGFNPQWLKKSREINESLPLKVAKRIRELLSSYGKDPSTAKVFITGIAFKGQPETDDLRGSPALTLINALQRRNMTRLFVHDFVVKDETLRLRGMNPVSMKEGFSDADAVIIGNNHPSYQKINLKELFSTANMPVILFDSWRMIDSSVVAQLKGLHYEGIGLQNKILEEYRHG